MALLTDTYAAAVPILREAQRRSRTGCRRPSSCAGCGAATVSALHLWDDEGWERLSDRHLQLVRETGALGDLPIALSHRGQMHVFAGELATAASLHEAIQEATELTGSPLAPYHGVGLVAMRGREAEARQFIDTARAEVIAARRGGRPVVHRLGGGRAVQRARTLRGGAGAHRAGCSNTRSSSP